MSKIYTKIGLGKNPEEMTAYYPAIEVEYENEEDLKKILYEKVNSIVEAALFEFSQKEQQ